MITAALVLVFTILLAVAFVVFRTVEARQNRRFFDATRTAWDQRVTTAWHALVTGGVPREWREHAAVVLHRATQSGVHVAVTALRAAERPLARLSYKMRVSAPKAGTGQVSEFLKTITPDKGSQNSARVV